MDQEKFKSVVECMLFVANRPITMDEMVEVTGSEAPEIERVMDEIRMDLESKKSSIQIVKVAEGYQFATHPGYGYWIKKLFRDQATFRLSQSALETLSIVAYKQPITRAEIEEIRGVEVIGVLETLIERKLVKIAGRKESVGRPLLYSTSPEFLRHFNLWKVSDLPSLEDLAKEAELKKNLGTVSPQEGSMVSVPVENVEVVQHPGEESQPHAEETLVGSEAAEAVGAAVSTETTEASAENPSDAAEHSETSNSPEDSPNA